MKKLKLLTLLVLLYSFSVFSQSIDCASKVKSILPSRSFTFNEASKSATCVTGKKYEFMLPLVKGKDYRISFFASSIFNNKINFRIIDTNSGEKVLDLPGMVDDPKKGTCVLGEYLDKIQNRMVHPYFDFHPSASTTLKIIIDIAEKEQIKTDDGGYDMPKDTDKGCITVYIQDRKTEADGFK